MVRLAFTVLLGAYLTTFQANAQILELIPADAEQLPQPSETSVDQAPLLLEDTEQAETGPPPAPQPLVPDAESAFKTVAPEESVEKNTERLPVTELRGEPIERGPIHEAFAEPLQHSPQPTKLIKKAPPAAIEEMAPEAPKGAKNMKWIDGYWAWDDQREDYVWVSGTWRKIPKGRTWLAGNWQEVDGGHQWVPGAWVESATKTTAEIVDRPVLPAPPESLEQGPTSPAPSDNHFWVPGVWQQNVTEQYVWRPGFWSQSQKNWVWVPDHYSWTPAGCRYVSGYWDYTWERRGTLYAPCTFRNTNWSGRVCYTPTRVIDTNQWLASLWVAPGYGHYYYGDYYDCLDRGYSPWYSYYGANRSFYDPFYTYYRWRFPSTYGIGLYTYLDGLHTYYRRNPNYRPSISFHTYRNRPISRSYSSLYGNVPQLYRYLGLGAYSDRFRHSPFRSYSNLDRYRTPNDRYRDYSNRDYGYGRQFNGYRGGYNGLSANDLLRKQRTDRRREIEGYANGQPLYRGDRDRPGVTRAEMGTGKRNRPKPSSDASRSRPTRQLPINSSTVDRAINRAAGSPHRQNTGPNPFRASSNRILDTRPQSSVLSRTQERPTSRPPFKTQSRPQKSIQARTQASRPQTRPETRPQPKPQSRPRATVQSRPQTRPQPRPKVTPQSRPQSRPRATVQSRPQGRPQPRPQVKPQSRTQPRPSVTRSTPAPKRSSPGFSTHSMKKARGADLARQRAAMQKHVSARKGKK